MENMKGCLVDKYNIVIVGEAFGEKEETEGKPFVGMAGRVLDTCLDEVGIDRSKCLVTNVVMARPPYNVFSAFSDETIKKGVARLRQEIINCDPNIVIALGEQALRALTTKTGILNWRGSVITGVTGHKVIPSVHPAAVSREWVFRPMLINDLQRAKTESLFKDLRITPRNLIVAYKFEEAMEYLKRIKEEATYVAFDIETESEQITCIGFSPSYRDSDGHQWAVCIPFWFGASGSLFSKEQEVDLWGAIRAILDNDAITKYAQNGMFDVEVLRRTMGLDVQGFRLDTMLAFHTLYAELPRDLAFLVSLYTDHPYYKDEIKSPSMDEYFRYNAKDAVLTAEIAVKLEAELEECKRTEFYNTHVHALVEPLLAMQAKGVGFNYLRRNSVKKRVQEEIAVLQKRLDDEVGHPLNVNSPKQMKEWLYGELKLKVKTKKRKATGETTVAADEEAIRDLYKETGNESLKKVLDIREGQKLLSTYLEMRLDTDKRVRCSYLISGTETGRLSSRSTLRGTGTNLQNIPNGDRESRWYKISKTIKELFVPDEGMVFVNADLSQAEARVVAYISGDERLIRVFEQGGDIHRRNAANIFNIKPEEVTDDQRQLAKRVVHASNYGMGPVTFAKTAGLPAADARRLLNQYFATYPGIKRWHLNVSSKLKCARVMETPMGRKRVFFNRYDETTVKEALAFVPQSTVADIVNQALVDIHARRLEVFSLDILLQVHDSLLFQVNRDKLDDAIRLIRDCMTRPIEIGGKVLIIPVDFKTGENWGEMTSYAIPSPVIIAGSSAPES